MSLTDPVIVPQITAPQLPQLATNIHKPFMERLGGMLFPTTGYEGVDPELQKQLQNRALLTLGLGMLAGKRRGFGQAALGGLSMASDQYGQAMQNAYANARQTRAEETDAARRAEDMDLKKTIFGAEEARAARQEQATEAWRQKQAEIEQRRLEIAAKTAASGTADDAAVADLRRLQAEELRTRQELMKGLRDKVARGEMLTEDEKSTWQMVMTGRQPTENPWAAILNGGLGGGTPGATPPAGDIRSRMLGDQRMFQ